MLSLQALPCGLDVLWLFESACGHYWALFDAVKHSVWPLGSEDMLCSAPRAPDLLLQQWEGEAGMQTHSAGSGFCSYEPCHDFSLEIGNLKEASVYLDLFLKALAQSAW